MTYAPASRYAAGLMMPAHVDMLLASGLWCGTSTGTANAQVIAPPVAGSLAANPRYTFRAGYSNTGAMTLSADGGATNTSLRKADGTAMVGGEIVSGTAYQVVFDGTYWRLIGGAGKSNGLFSGISAKTTNYTITVPDAGFMFDASGGITMTLALASVLGGGFSFGVANTGASAVTLAAASGNTINGSASISIGPGEWLIVTCDGTRFLAFGKYGLFGSSEAWSSADRESSLTLSNSNLTATAASGGAYSGRAIIPLSGKRYWECKLDAAAGGGLSAIVGIATAAAGFSLSYGLASSAGGYGYANDTGRKLNNSTEVAFGSTWAAGDIIGIAYDDVSSPGNIRLWFSKNGVWQASGDPATGANPAFTISAAIFFPAVSCKGGGSITARFTAASWAYAAPAGFGQIA